MVDVYVLNEDLEPIGLIDYYTSLIWANRYIEEGDCELYVRATPEALNLLKKGRYLTRPDDKMVCQIRKIELETNVESGNYLIVTGYDSKILLKQRIVWNQTNVDGLVEEHIRNLVNSSLSSGAANERQIKNSKGEVMFLLGPAKGFKAPITEQVTYKNVAEKTKELCQNQGWGYEVYVENEKFYFDLYEGTNRADTVIFSQEYENLISTKYSEDGSNLGNVALVGGEGEGSERAKNISGAGDGVNRHEVFVDAKDLSKTITYKDLIEQYPGGIVTNSTYQIPSVNVQIVDDKQLQELRVNYPDGTILYIEGNLYYQVSNVVIADLPSNEVTENDDVTLRDIIYNVYLLNAGYESLSEYGLVTSFEGSIEPSTTFKYKEDYFLGDIVTVENEFGLTAEARITEIVEVFDESGYSVEPKFEYLELDNSSLIKTEEITVSGVSPLKINSDFKIPLVNYRIYGNTGGVGDLVDGKYQIPIKIEGKNMVKESDFSGMWSNGVSNTYDGVNHTITFNEEPSSGSGRYKFFSIFTPNRKYTISFYIKGTPGKKVACGWHTAATNIILAEEYKRYSATITATSTSLGVIFYSHNLLVGEYMQFKDVQIEEGDTMTEYESYKNPTPYTISLDEPLKIRSNSYFNYEESKPHRSDTEKVIVDDKKAYKQAVSNTLTTLPLWNENIFWDKLIDGETYTLSFYVKANRTIEATQRVYINQQVIACNPSATTEWRKVTVSFKFNASKTSYIFHVYPNLQAGDIIYYADFKLFKGDTENEILYEDFLDFESQSMTKYVDGEFIKENVYLPTIPTFENTSVLSVNTIVQPSKCELTYVKILERS